jgi:spore maturation protein CgeB
VAQLEELRRSKTLAEELRQHGLKTIRNRHTCEHRVNELLGIITDVQGRKRLRKTTQPTFP